MLHYLKTFIRDERFKLKCLQSDILVYQMAKVASFGVYKSLKQLGCSVSHFHFLTNVPSFCVGHTRGERLLLAVRGGVSSFFYRTLVRLRPRDYKIITLVREPLSRNVSLMFQMFADLLGPALQAGGGASVEVDELELLSRMFARLNQNYPAQWLDGELKQVFGIDVLAHPFDKEKGYAIIKQGRVSVLVLRAEDLSANQDVIGAFAGVEGFSLQSTNRASKKWYANLHRRFNEGYVPEIQLLDRLYDSDYMKHFYADQQIQAFRNKWVKCSQESE